MELDLRDELELAQRLARQAGAHILALHATGLTVERKLGDEPVTRADREANQLIVDGLSARFGSDGLLSEEAPDDGSRLTAERVWMIDPLDGTKDFIRGHEGFATMIGLLIGERPALGVVYQPLGDRLYWAARGQGAWLIEGGAAAERLHVSDVAELTAIRMVASKSHRDETIDHVRARLGITDELNVGSVGLKLGLIARGVRDLYVNPASHSKLWDACAPEAILAEAGGRLTDVHGELLGYRGRELGNVRGLIASNGVVHDEVVAKLASLFAGKP
ncbi:MAG TPA: 3'(2'),5'-bisphosphate nucleotidase CysQ [Polyangia bacterium]|nr:3'(2'),5'-bisphosphate nucleotidase CysQ [Polyangia bacterium]